MTLKIIQGHLLILYKQRETEVYEHRSAMFLGTV